MKHLGKKCESQTQPEDELTYEPVFFCLFLYFLTIETPLTTSLPFSYGYRKIYPADHFNAYLSSTDQSSWTWAWHSSAPDYNLHFLAVAVWQIFIFSDYDCELFCAPVLSALSRLGLWLADDFNFRLSMRGWAESQACADPGARTRMGTSGNLN